MYFSWFSGGCQSYADEWEAAGFKPKARTFLMRFVTWDIN